MSKEALLIIMSILFIGLYSFVKIAQREPSSWRLKSFFLGGANIGPELTEHNTLGITFAWSGGTWFFAWFGYQYGPRFILYQLYWVISVVGIGLLLPSIIRKIKNKTLHGYLGDHYGVRTQRIAACATTIGYIINMGFELFWSSLLFSACIGHPEYALPFACILAITVGIYCSIGGYRSNAHTDKTQNILAVTGLGALVLLTSSALNLPDQFMLAVYIFAGGSVLYVIIAILYVFVSNKVPSWILNAIPIALVGMAFYITYFLLHPSSATILPQYTNILENKDTPVVFFVAMFTFQLFFNIIDMQNWQQIAANAEMQDEAVPGLRWSIVRGALYLFWFPALGGILLGCALRALNGSANLGVNGEAIFTIALQHVLPGAGEFIRASVLGVILLGFISSTLSTADSLLMSKVQTIFYDLVWRSRIASIINSNKSDKTQQDEYSVVFGARTMLIPFALISVLFFYAMYTFYSGQVGYFQSLMYALPLSLFAPAIYALFWPDRVNEFTGKCVFAGISCSIIIVTCMFVIASLDGSTYDIKTFIPTLKTFNLKEWLPALAPIVANIISVFAIILSIALNGVTGSYAIQNKVKE